MASPWGCGCKQKGTTRERFVPLRDVGLWCWKAHRRLTLPDELTRVYDPDPAESMDGWPTPARPSPADIGHLHFRQTDRVLGADFRITVGLPKVEMSYIGG